MEDEMLELIDLGAEDVEDFLVNNMQRYLVYIEGSQLNIMSTKLTQAGYEVEQAEVTLKPNTLVEIKDKESAKKVLDFAQKLEELDDIQKVYANFDIPNNLLSGG